MAQQADILWKGVLQEVFDDFLRFFYPEADKVFDLRRGVTFLDKELAQLHPTQAEGRKYSTKLVDTLAKIYTRDGQEKWVLIHLEVQGIFRKNFAFRMFTYYYRILDRYQQRITACAILTEPVLKPRTGIYEQEFLGTSIRYQFNVYKIIEQDEAALWASDNPFALVVLIAKSKFVGKDIKDPEERDKALLAFKRELLRVLRSRSIPERKVRALFQFLTNYVHFENYENDKIFTNEIQNYKTMDTQKLFVEVGKAVGREMGRMEGSHKKKIELDSRHTRSLLKFTDHSEEKIAELLEVSLSFVQQMQAKLQERAKRKFQEVNK